MIILSHNSLEPSSIVFFIGASDGYFNASEQYNVPGRVITNHPNMGKGYEGPKQQNSLKIGAAEVLQLELLELKYPKPPLWNCPSKLWPCSRGLAYSNPITRKICLVLSSHKQLSSVLYSSNQALGQNHQLKQN
jgi:hypothetical protein